MGFKQVMKKANNVILNKVFRGVAIDEKMWDLDFPECVFSLKNGKKTKETASTEESQSTPMPVKVCAYAACATKQFDGCHTRG